MTGKNSKILLVNTITLYRNVQATSQVICFNSNLEFIKHLLMCSMKNVASINPFKPCSILNEMLSLAPFSGQGEAAQRGWVTCRKSIRQSWVLKQVGQLWVLCRSPLYSAMLINWLPVTLLLLCFLSITVTNTWYNQLVQNKGLF